MPVRIVSFLFGLALLGATPAAALKPVSQAALQTMVAATARELLVPPALVLPRTPQGDFTAAYGTTQLGTTNAPRTATNFRVASNTKTMTAAVIVQLAQEGKLKFSDPVSKYVAGVPNGENITIAELLDMRSGLYNYTDSPEVAAIIDHDMSKVWTPAELLAIAFARPPNFDPDAKYEYCNTNYVLLGLVIEKVGRKALAAAMPPSKVCALPEPFSHGYLYGSSSVALSGTPPYSPAVQAAARAGTLQPTDYTNLNPSFAAAAGGVVSNADDLATWIEALVSGRVLDTEYQQRWLESLRPVDPDKP